MMWLSGWQMSAGKAAMKFPVEIVRRVEGLAALADQLEVRLAKGRGEACKLAPSLPLSLP